MREQQGWQLETHSRNHVSCHYLHYLDWEQAVMSPSIITPLMGDIGRGGEEKGVIKHLSGCSANPDMLVVEHQSSGRLK